VRFQSYCNTAVTIINAYKGGVPFVHHLKQYFAAHKKHGSTDRRTIAHLCYTYYRLGASISNFDTDKGLQLLATGAFYLSRVGLQPGILQMYRWIKN
jgi:16S rRNA (cytosine967-C5)-methyltransferase